MLPPIFRIIYAIMKKYYPGGPFNIYIQSLINIIQDNNKVITIGGCEKAGRKNGDMECSNIGASKGTYDVVILENRERSRAVRSYANVTREDVQMTLGQNRLTIP